MRVLRYILGPYLVYRLGNGRSRKYVLKYAKGIPSIREHQRTTEGGILRKSNTRFLQLQGYYSEVGHQILLIP